jgi:hypothetical protein
MFMETTLNDNGKMEEKKNILLYRRNTFFYIQYISIRLQQLPKLLVFIFKSPTYVRG